MDFAVETKKQGTLTVLEKSRELFALIVKVAADDNLIPKYFKDSLGIPLVTHARNIYENLAVANSIDLFDKELGNKRRDFQILALYDVSKLLATLRIVYTLVQLSADKMQVLLTKTIEVKRLCAKWMESDKNRLGASLQIIAKDPIETNLFDKGITAKDLFNDTPRIDFDALYKAASSSPAPEKHFETGQTLYIPPPPTTTSIYRPESPPDTRSREQRISDVLASRLNLSQRPEVPDAPIKEKISGPIQSVPLGTPDSDNKIGPVVEPTPVDPIPESPLTEEPKATPVLVKETKPKKK